MKNEESFVKYKNTESTPIPKKHSRNIPSTQNSFDLDKSGLGGLNLTATKLRVPLWIRIIGIVWCLALIVLELYHIDIGGRNTNSFAEYVLCT